MRPSRIPERLAGLLLALALVTVGRAGLQSGLLFLEAGELERAEAALAEALAGAPEERARASRALVELALRSPSSWQVLSRLRRGLLGAGEVPAERRALAELELSLTLDARLSEDALRERVLAVPATDREALLALLRRHLPAAGRAELLDALPELSGDGRRADPSTTLERIDARRTAGEDAVAASIAREALSTRLEAPLEPPAPLFPSPLRELLRRALLLHPPGEPEATLAAAVAPRGPEGPERYLRRLVVTAELERRRGRRADAAEHLRRAGATLDLLAEQGPVAPAWEGELAWLCLRLGEPGAGHLLARALARGWDPPGLRRSLAALPFPARDGLAALAALAPERGLAVPAARALARTGRPLQARELLLATLERGPLHAALETLEPLAELGEGVRALAVLVESDHLKGEPALTLPRLEPLARDATLHEALLACVEVLRQPLPRGGDRAAGQLLARLTAVPRGARLAVARRLPAPWSALSRAAILGEAPPHPLPGLDAQHPLDPTLDWWVELLIQAGQAVRGIPVLEARLAGAEGPAARSRLHARLARLYRAAGDPLRGLAHALWDLEASPRDPRRLARVVEDVTPRVVLRRLLHGWWARVENDHRFAPAIARLWAATGKPHRGLWPLELAHRRAPGDPTLAAALGRHRLSRGELDEALSSLRDALRPGGYRYRDDASLYLALALMKSDAAAEALGLYRLWIGDAVDPAPLAGELVALATGHGLEAEARALLAELGVEPGEFLPPPGEPAGAPSD